MKEIKKINYLDRQKVRNLHDQTVSPFHQIFLEKWRRGKRPLPSRGIFGKHDMILGNRLLSQARWKYQENLQEIRYASQQQKINHCPFGMYDTIIHPLNLPVGGVPQLISALLLIFWNRKCFCRRASRKYTTFFVRWSWLCSTLLKTSCIVR